MQPVATAPAPSQFLIDQIFPTRTVHLVSGASGTGKTTFLLQTLNDWTAGLDVLGHKSFPVPFCYMSCTRGRDELTGIVSRLDLKNLPDDALVTLPRDRAMPEDVSLEAALKLARHRVPGLRLLVLDGMGVLCRGRITDYNVVSDFMRKVHDICRADNLTIIGLGPHAKGEIDPGQRARFLGSVAWGENASTMAVITGEEDSTDRTVKILGSSFAMETYTYQMGADGRFILTTDDSAAWGALDMKLGALKPGDEFETSTALQWGRDIGAARSTVMNWLKKRKEDGVIESIKRGFYRLKFTA